MQAVRSVGLDRLKRFVCLLLIFVLLFCFFLAPRAQAVAVEAATIAYAGALVGTILVGAGVAFASHGDMQKVGAAMMSKWQQTNDAIAAKMITLATWAVNHEKDVASGALRVGQDLYQAIVDAFNASYSDGAFTTGDFLGAELVDAIAARGKSDFWMRMPDYIGSSRWDVSRFYVYHFYFTQLSSKSVYAHIVQISNGGSAVCDYGSSTGAADNLVSYSWRFDATNGSIGFVWSASDGSSSYGDVVNLLRFPSDWQNVIKFSAVPFTDVSIPAPDLKYPSDDYLVKMPDIPSVDAATGEATFPADAAYTKDAVSVPYPTDADGVKVPDIPYDKVVDQSTGKTLDDTGTDTDTPSKPGEGTDTDNPSDSVNWPSAGDISLPKLIISKFPFCIPFDVARLIGLLEADPKTPIFHVPLKVGTILDEEIVLDLSQWDNVVRIIRWGELIVFVAGLVLVTRNYIKW